jgi:uncharacterized protein
MITKHVTDQAGLLSATERSELEDLLSRFEAETSTQIAVLILADLGGRAAEEVSMEVFEANRIGQKGKDNGVLLLVALQERTVRIEVGYGLEGVLSDARSALIIERELKPSFRQGAYGEGIRKAVAAIIETTKGEYRADDAPRPGRTIGMFLLLLVLILFTSALRLRRATRGPFIAGRGWSGHTGWASGSGSRSWGGGGWSGGGGFAGGGGATGRW